VEVRGKGRFVMKDVAVIGVGQSSFVRGYEGSIRELAFEAFREAMQDAGITQKEVDASIFCSAPEYDKQRSPAGVLAEYLGLIPQPTFYVESVCSSSSTGVKVGYSMIKSGLHDMVVVLGFQKMSEITSAESQERMGRGADIQWEAPFGTMMPAYYALYAQAYMSKHGLTHDDLMGVRLKSSTYGVINERAVYRKPVKPGDFKQGDPEAKLAGPVAWPLRVGDCCANADGSFWIRGIGAASEAVNMAARPDFAKGLSVGYAAAAQAYKMAGIAAKNVKVAEVHDCFTIAEIMAYEGLGFAPAGDGKQLIREKATYKEGKIPVNVDGGLLSKGHPIGATGGSQIRTIVLQLRGEAGPMQVPGAPDIGLVHNIGGVGLYGNVTIFSRD
jgi:acetyl-CoA C-acetyltransferase